MRFLNKQLFLYHSKSAAIGGWESEGEMWDSKKLISFVERAIDNSLKDLDPHFRFYQCPEVL